MPDETSTLDTLAWATNWANQCEHRFGNHLCHSCTRQGRSVCALADFARRLIANRYGAPADQPDPGGA